ncbi:hypothetical protein ACS0TY_022921 [Phlomoides rotata]
MCASIMSSTGTILSAMVMSPLKHSPWEELRLSAILSSVWLSQWREIQADRVGHFRPWKREELDSQSAGEHRNIIITSATTLTFVPSNLYESFEAALKSAIRATPTTDPSGTFKLCYSSPSKDFALSITTHFEGADVVLPRDQTFMKVSEGLYCLTLVPSPDLAIFGNLHQAGLLIGYDIPKKKVSFLPTDCTKSR